jgi:hypothetical protein
VRGARSGRGNAPADTRASSCGWRSAAAAADRASGRGAVRTRPSIAVFEKVNFLSVSMLCAAHACMHARDQRSPHGSPAAASGGGRVARPARRVGTEQAAHNPHLLHARRLQQPGGVAARTLPRRSLASLPILSNSSAICTHARPERPRTAARQSHAACEPGGEGGAAAGGAAGGAAAARAQPRPVGSGVSSITAAGII